MSRRDSATEDISALLRIMTPSVSGGRRLMLIGAEANVGTSALARRLAIEVGEAFSRPTWLYDLDLVANGQFAAASSIAPLTPGKALDASLSQPAFWRLVSSTGHPIAPPSRHMLTLHQMGESRAFVARFRSDLLPAGSRIQVQPQGDYWKAASSAAGGIIVDSPSLDRSRAGLAVANQMDAVAIVISGRHGEPASAMALRNELEQRGAPLVGLVLTQASAEARLAAKWLG
jgi:hypothetical protein